MNSLALEKTLECTLDIVRRASALMISKDFDVEEKGGCVNIVTSSDFAVQEFLVKELSALLPGCGFICEEEGINDASKEYVWVIDPIDGTANYARQWDACCISVGLLHNSVQPGAAVGDDAGAAAGDGAAAQPGRVILGVVYSPKRGEMYSAADGLGAFCNGRPIHCSKRSFEESIFCCALSTYRKEYAGMCSAIVMDTFPQCNDIRRFGSAALEMCFVAAGYCELHFEIRLQPWDYAAGLVIIREAGGIVTNLEGVQPRFDGADIICSANNVSNHARLLDIIRKHIPARPYND